MKPLTLEDILDIAARTPAVRQAMREAMLKDGAPAEMVSDDALATKVPEFAALIREDGADAEAAIVAFCNALYDAGRAAARTWRSA